MTATTSDGLALLAAIREHPDEDMPRLMLADVLEDTDPARAELIRVQCELERLDRCTDRCRERIDFCCDTCLRESMLKARADELRAANADRWRRGPACERCGGKRTAASVGEQRSCPDCFGTGDAGGLMRVLNYTHEGETRWGVTAYGLDEKVRVTYHRGLKRVHCRSEDIWRSVADHDNNDRCWLPTAWASAVCRHHPDCTELWLTDREPYHYRAPAFPYSHVLSGLYRWGRRTSFGDENTDLVPDPVFELLPRVSAHDQHALRCYPDADTARRVLGNAAVRWVHSHAAK